MKRLISALWRRGVVSTFVTGLFVVLPIAVTVLIMGWAGRKLQEAVGPGSTVGNALQSIGLRFVTNPHVATAVGYAMIIVLIWVLGLFVKSVAKDRVSVALNAVVNRVPIVRSIYGPVAQVIGMLKKDEDTELSGMPVVFFELGDTNGSGMLALLVSSRTYRFADRDCSVIYIPTSPVPMSGGILFVPCERVRIVDMTVDDLMKIYFSLGVLAPQAVPAEYAGHTTAAAAPLPPQASGTASV